MPNSTTCAIQTCLYLYGITKVHWPPLAGGPGIMGAGVEQVIEGSLAAIVSRLPVQKLRPERANLAAHHQLMRQLAERTSLLPMAFGTVADDEEDLRDLLRRNYDDLLKLLEWLDGKVEMGLKVYWDTPNIFEYFVANHRELQAMRDSLFHPGRVASVEEKIELGKRFESLLHESRQRHTRRVIEALSPYCVEIRTVDLAEERMIMKLACLVQKDRQQQWEAGVEQVARVFDNHYRFACSGPFAAHSFVDISLELDQES